MIGESDFIGNERILADAIKRVFHERSTRRLDVSGVLSNQVSHTEKWDNLTPDVLDHAINNAIGQTSADEAILLLGALAYATLIQFTAVIGRDSLGIVLNTSNPRWSFDVNFMQTLRKLRRRKKLRY